MNVNWGSYPLPTAKISNLLGVRAIGVNMPLREPTVRWTGKVREYPRRRRNLVIVFNLRFRYIPSTLDRLPMDG